MVLHPESARLVTSLKMSIAYTIIETLFTPIAPLASSTATVQRVQTFIAGQEWMPAPEKAEWAYQAKGQRALPFCAVLLSLLPNLKSLEFEKDGLPDDPFAHIFWSTSCTELEDFAGAVVRLGACAGLRGLKSWKGGVAGQFGLAPFQNVATLTTVDVSLRRMGEWNVDGYLPLEQVRTLRVDCGAEELPRDLRSGVFGINLGLPMVSNGLKGLYDGLSRMVGVFTKLKTVEFYAHGKGS
ncbi:hypothetical protein NX059_011683 [Plenodomus lindquistii]|nr:hypothetical protein NX059_011683 [Plenodomus lindquistii]